MLDLFAESESPYQHLEEYQYQLWLRDRAALLERNGAEAPLPTSLAASRCIRTASTFQFEPLQIEISQGMTQTDDFHLYSENQTATLMLSSNVEHIQQASATNGNEIESQWRVLEERGREGNEVGVDRKISISFNTTDYIIKHCLKKMLSPEFRDQVEPICESEQLTYPQFCLYWKDRLEKYLPNKHIGLTRFKKMIDETKSRAVVACRQFLTLYLWHEYPRYVAVGQMRNKQEYLRCASKLMYISCLPKRGSETIYGARKQ